MNLVQLVAENVRIRSGVHDVKTRVMGEYIVFDYYETEECTRPSGSKKIARDWFENDKKAGMAVLMIENAPDVDVPTPVEDPLPFDE